MKSRHIFWGIFFLALGILILLNNYTSFSFDWESLLKLWPVVFILWGISILIKDNKFVSGFLTALVGLILALTLFSGFKFIFNFDKWDFTLDDNDGIVFNGDVDSTTYYEIFNPNTKKAVLNFDGGAGEINISDTTNNLVDAFTLGVRNNYKFKVKNNDETSKIYLDMQKARISFNKMKNKVDIKLNRNPLWDLDFDLGAAKAYLDLSQFKLEKIKIDAGAASLKIKLGDLSESIKLDVDAGASSINISIPESSGCKIVYDGALSSKHFNGFEKINSELYKTANFDSATKKIYINLDGGVSSITIDRYDLWDN